MLVDTRKLHTVRTWAKNYNDGRGASTSAIYKLFDEDNMQPQAQAIRKEHTLLKIDGVFFVVKNSDIPKRKTKTKEVKK